MFYINLDYESKERYDMGKFMNYDVGYDMLDSYFMSKIKSLRVHGQYAVQSEENRPDVLSYKIYGDTQYWWILLMYNSLLEPDELVAGLVIQYPYLGAIEDLYFELKSLETAVS